MDIPKVEVKKILYATDLSENARHAFAYAVSLANLLWRKNLPSSCAAGGSGNCGFACAWLY